MKWLRVIHTTYGMVVFCILFAFLFPLLMIPVLFPSLFVLTGILNRIWAKLMFILIFIPYRVIYRAPLSSTKQYIFCPNHFSYLDIPALGLNYINTIFVGKSDLEHIPLFGFMYKQLHITVDRNSLRSRSESLQRSLTAIDEGKSLVIFPEGGIVMDKTPEMGPFRDGAFRVAIEKQIEVVPVTIPFNWIILPGDQFLLRWHPLKIVFHEPIPTVGLTHKDAKQLKTKVYQVIQEELQKHLAVYENRSNAFG